MLEVAQGKPRDILGVEPLANARSSASLYALLDCDKGTLGLGLVHTLCEGHAQQSDEVHLCDLCGVVPVLEVLADRRNLFLCQIDFHVLVQGGCQFLSGQPLVLVAVIEIEERSHVHIELLNLGCQWLNDVLDRYLKRAAQLHLPPKRILEVLQS